MEAMLTYFCKTHNVEYIEGLSDVLLPVLSLPISSSQTFQCFTALVKKFIPKMAFRPVSTAIGGVDGLLQSNPTPLNPLLKMFHLLVMYHDPKLGRFLEQNRVYPEMYADAWLNLLMSRSCEPEALFRLWDAYIVQQKPSLNVFVALAVLIRARESVLNSSREATLQQLGSICISTAKEAAQLLEKAGTYMHATPVSVQHLLVSSSFSHDDDEDEEEEYETITTATSTGEPELQPFVLKWLREAFCLQVTGTDVYVLVSTHTHTPSSSISVSASVDALGTTSNSNKIAYVLLDCRSKEDSQSGRPAKALELNSDCLEDSDRVAELLRSLEPFRGRHLCVFGSGDESDVGTMNDFVLHFLKKSFPHVSTLQGGYAAYHDLVADKAVELVDHEPNACRICIARSLSAAPVTAAGATAQAKKKPNITEALHNFKGKLESNVVLNSFKEKMGSGAVNFKSKVGGLFDKKKSSEQATVPADEKAAAPRTSKPKLFGNINLFNRKKTVDTADVSGAASASVPTVHGAPASHGKERQREPVFEIGDERRISSSNTSPTHSPPTKPDDTRGSGPVQRLTSKPQTKQPGDKGTEVDVDDFVSSCLGQLFGAKKLKRRSGLVLFTVSVPRYLVLSKQNLYVLEAKKTELGKAIVKSKHQLVDIARMSITEKKPPVVTLEYRSHTNQQTVRSRSYEIEQADAFSDILKANLNQLSVGVRLVEPEPSPSSSPSSLFGLLHPSTSAPPPPPPPPPRTPPPMTRLDVDSLDGADDLSSPGSPPAVSMSLLSFAGKPLSSECVNGASVHQGTASSQSAYEEVMNLAAIPADLDDI
eukprot:GILK01016969.1.p1 GENE.GILK01016969.1~~GILK01016969.1.p1  ORF type:complete len:931 (+),score=209.96 GILK01016969.1:335-2794(+)